MASARPKDGNSATQNTPKPTSGMTTAFPPSSQSHGIASNTSNSEAASSAKRKHRAGKKKKKNRRQSFAAPSAQPDIPDTGTEIPSLLDVPEHKATEEQFNRLGAVRRDSHESLDSEALLDHRYV